MKPVLLLGPALVLASGVAGGLSGAGDALVPPPAGTPGLDYLLTLGPYGALVWGAYLLGKGVKVTIQVELSERDRQLLSRFAEDSARR